MYLRTVRMLFVVIIAFTLVTLSACGTSPSPTPPPAPTKASEPAASPTKASTPFKAGLMVEGPMADTGFNISSWEVLQEVGKKYGWEYSYTDNVKADDMEDIFRGYGQQGFNVVYAPGWLFGDAIKKVAAEFPNTRYVHIAVKNEGGPNLYSAGWVAGEMSYFAGQVAGTLTKSGKLGYIAGTEDPVLAYEESVFEQGAKLVNPNVTVTMSYVGSWDDPAKAKELANAQMESGVDIILSASAGSDFGTFEAVKEATKAGKNVKVIGWVGDQCKNLPDQVLLSLVQLPGDLVRVLSEQITNNTLKPGYAVYGTKEGAQRLAWCGKNVPADLQTKIDQAMKDYLDGKLEVPHRTDL